jgi:ABC-type antimicrobial peptide transport system permease subunit
MVGLGVGLGGAWATTRLLEGLLFGVAPMDTRTLLAAAVVLGAVASLAIWIPARRASQVDPGRMLSGE